MLSIIGYFRYRENWRTPQDMTKSRNEYFIKTLNISFYYICTKYIQTNELGHIHLGGSWAGLLAVLEPPLLQARKSSSYFTRKLLGHSQIRLIPNNTDANEVARQ